MNKQRVMLVILLFLVLAHLYCAIVGVGYRHRGKPFNDFGKVYPVRSIRLLQNNMFEVTIADGGSTTILGSLNGGIKSGSKNKIINILNKAKNPSLCVLGKYGDTTLIDFIFILDGNDIKFSDWLQSNRLWLTTI